MKQTLLLFHLIYRLISNQNRLRLSKLSGCILLVLFLLGLSNSATAQLTEVWDTGPFKHSSGSGTDNTKQEIDKDKNLIILGSGMTLFKYDQSGKLIWEAKYEAGTDTDRMWTYDLWLDDAGNSYISGMRLTTAGTYEDMLAKFSAQGQLIWGRNFNRTVDGVIEVNDLFPNADGTSFITGVIKEGSVTKMVTQKLNAKGDVVWSTKYDEEGDYPEPGTVVAADGKGNVYALTRIYYSYTRHLNDIQLIKYNAETGAQISKYTYPFQATPQNYEAPVDLFIAPSGAMYIVAETSGEPYVFDIVLYRIDASGKLEWAKIVGDKNENDYFEATLLDNEDLVMLCRQTRYRNIWDHFITKFDKSGNQLWNHKFNVYENVEGQSVIRQFTPGQFGLSVNGEGKIAIAGSYSVFNEPPSWTSAIVYRENPKLMLTAFSENGKETWRLVMNEYSTSRNYSAGLRFIDNKNLYFTGQTSGSETSEVAAAQVAMKFTDCSGLQANAGADKEICAGDNVQLQASGGTSYTWSPAAGLSATNIANPVATPTETTTYTVTITNADGCTDTDEVTIKVNPKPVASITVDGETSFCQGGSVTLTANSGTGYTYQWLKDSNPINQATTATLTARESGNYTVIVKSSGGCAATATGVKVTVTPAATASAGADKEICARGSAQLQATGGATYTWSPATGLSATNIANPVANPATTTTYTVTVTNAEGCSATDQIIVKVVASPQVTITAGSETTFCEGGSVKLTASAGTGYTYQWFKDGNPINQATSASFTSFNSGSFTVKVKNSGGCEAESTPVKVTVNKPFAVSAGAEQEVCTNTQAFALSGFSPAGGTWTGKGVSADGTFNPATAGAGQHTLTYSVTQNSCTVTATKKISVSQAVATPGAITGNTTLCAGTSDVSYSISAVSGATNYTWTVPSGFSITSGQGTATIKVKAGTAGGQVTVKAENNCGTSQAASLTINVTAIPTTTITTSGNTSVCEGGNVTLNASTGSNYTYQWLRDNQVISGATGTTYNATTSGSYTVRVTNGDCAQTSSAVAVTVNPTISGNAITTGNQSVCSGATAAEIKASVPKGGSGSYTYQWEQSTDGTNFTAIQNAAGQNYTPATITATTWFRRKVTSGDCSHLSESIKVTLNQAPKVSLSSFAKMCTDDAKLTLTGGQPEGGTYSGTGVAGGIFDPVVAGAGVHTISYTYAGEGGCTVVATQTITVEECVTGVDEEEPPYTFTLFPNPTDSWVTIEVELPNRTNITLLLLDARGRVILQKDYKDFTGAFNRKIELQDMARGMYFLKLITNEGTYHRKIIRQ